MFAKQFLFLSLFLAATNSAMAITTIYNSKNRTIAAIYGNGDARQLFEMLSTYETEVKESTFKFFQSPQQAMTIECLKNLKNLEAPFSCKVTIDTQTTDPQSVVEQSSELLRMTLNNTHASEKLYQSLKTAPVIYDTFEFKAFASEDSKLQISCVKQTKSVDKNTDSSYCSVSMLLK